MRPSHPAKLALLSVAGLALASFFALAGHAQPVCREVYPRGTILGDRGFCVPGPTSAATASPAPVEPPVSAGGSRSRPACPASMLLVPEGSFRMGSPDGEGENDEHPQTDVTLGAYCFDRTEVTAHAYTACVQERACTEPRPSPLYGSYGVPGREQFPINFVDWEQASAYCTWAGGRLPTEAEWEYAARGPDARRYPWGDEEPAGVPWPPNPRVSATVPRAAVGSSPWGRSWIGAEDLAGSMWEWVADWYAPYPGGSLRDPSGPRNGTQRVMRGGGASLDQRSWMRGAARMSNSPRFRADFLGFRCVRRVSGSRTGSRNGRAR